MNLMIAIVLMLLGAMYSDFWIVIGIAMIMVLSERNLSTLVLMIAAVGIIYGFKPVLSEYIPYLLLGMIILGMLFGKQQQQPNPMDMGMGGMGGMEGLYGPPMG